MPKPIAPAELDTVVERILRRYLDRPPAPPVPVDTRPRFKPTSDYPKGHLKNFIQRVEEERDFDVLLDPNLGPAEYQAHRAEYDLYFQRKPETEKEERAQKGVDAGGVTQSEFETPGFREKVRDAEKRALVEKKIAELRHSVTHLSADPPTE